MAPVSTATAKSVKAARIKNGGLNGLLAVEAPKEKRLKRFKNSPSSDVIGRMARALSQRMYLIEQEDVSQPVSGSARKFAVLGSTGNVYNVTVGQLPTCTCPDCARGNLCKHIIFVMARVLQVPRNSPLIYQSALLESELKEIFAKAPAPTAVLANTEVVAAYMKTVGDSEAVAEEPEEKKSQLVSNDKVPEGECPVCFESLLTSEPLDSCATCKNYVHKNCLKMWHAKAPNPMCCYCRSSWCSFGATPSSAQRPGAPAASAVGAAGRGGGVAQREGYVNLATQQGLSRQRDTSTYYTHLGHGRGRFGGGGGRGRFLDEEEAGDY